MSEVIVLGAANDPSRYAYMAYKLLKETGHTPIGVHPNDKEIMGEKNFPDLKSAGAAHPKVDTITMYVNPMRSDKMVDDILAIKPRRVIFNPGSENPALAKRLEALGVLVEEACTLVLLRTHQF